MDFCPGDQYVDLVGVDYYGHKKNGPRIVDIRRSAYADLVATGKPFGLGEYGPYHGLNSLEDPRSDYNYGEFTRDIKKQLPFCTSFLIWHHSQGLQFQTGARQCLEHPWVVNREDIPDFGRRDRSDRR